MDSPHKILKNVFISSGGNYLKLVDLHFSTTINKIVQRSSRKISWNEINTISKRKKNIQQFSTLDYSTNYKIYDGKHLLLIPGSIDPHVHFNTPGFEHRDDFEHGSNAAAFGGVTTVIDMPCTSLPPVTNKSNFKRKMQAVNNRSLIDYCFWGGVCGNDFDNNKNIEKQINELAQNGVAGFKSYLISGMKTFTDLNEERMLQTARWIKKTGKPLAVHAEAKELIISKMNRAKKLGLNSWEDYCNARDVESEVRAVKLMIEISKKTKCRAHVVHLSSKRALRLIKAAKKSGVNITAETCPHYLYFTQEDFKNSRISSFLKTAPPVKNEEDKEALWEGLNDGSLLFVTTDHAGCDPAKEKSQKNFWDVYGGIPGVEHRVPFLFGEGFKKNKLSLSKTEALLSTNIAEYFNIQNKGSIKVGYDSDFALIDLWSKQKVISKNMHSKGKYTPFEGITFEAVVSRTFLRGELIINGNKKTEQTIGFGKYLNI